MRNTLRFAVLTSKRHASACAIITSICSKEVAFSAHRSFATPMAQNPALADWSAPGSYPQRREEHAGAGGRSPRKQNACAFGPKE